ncbi:MAG: hypothetical protein ACJA1Z_001615 [Patiriisocius sp.]
MYNGEVSGLIDEIRKDNEVILDLLEGNKRWSAVNIKAFLRYPYTQKKTSIIPFASVKFIPNFSRVLLNL